MPISEQALYEQLKDTFLQPHSFFNPAFLLAYAANRYSDTVALSYGTISLTYQELYQKVQFWEQKLALHGVGLGDHVALFLHNSPAFYIAYCAAWQRGCVVVPLNFFLKTPELKSIITQTTIKVLFVESTLLSVWEALIDDSLFVITDEDINHAAYDIKSEYTYIDRQSSYNPDDLSVLMYTSGTTGVAKGVMLTGRSIMTNVCQSVARLGFASNEIVIAVLPLFHVFAQMASFWMSFLLGATVVLVARIERGLLQEALQKRPTIFVGVPALYGFLCLMKNASLDTVRIFISGGDALPDKVRLYFAFLYGRIIANGYGLSETSPVIALSVSDCLGVTNNVGKPLFDIEYKIQDENNKSCAPGNIGTLLIKSSSVMKGYYHDKEATNNVLTDDGWFNTGDFAYVTSGRNLVVTGRAKDLIIHKGFNIYPQEIENILLLHVSVIRVAVIGYEDAIAGQVPVAFVQVKKITDTLKNELMELCAQHLAQYKIPRSIVIQIEELPLTATAKIDKKRLIFESKKDKK